MANGQRAAIDTVQRRNLPRKAIVTVVGPPGAGKSWVLDKSAEIWQSGAGKALIARGEPFAADRPLFPWLRLASPGSNRLARLEVLKGGITHGSRAVPLFGAVTSFLVEEVLHHRKKRLSREALLLSAQEQDLLFVIQAAAQQHRLLLVIDHLESWDEASWSLLGLILSGKLDEVYPSLTNVLILVGATREIPGRLRELGSEFTITERSIRLIDRHEMPLALSVFRFPSLAPHDADVLYAVTNGRLDLLHDIGRYMRETDLGDLAPGWPDLYGDLVARRVRDLAFDAQGLSATLTAAAIIGQSFTISDIHCLTGYDLPQLHNTLQVAAGEHIISSLGDITRFASAELHRYFHRVGSSDHARYHAKFAECLRVMRPGDYSERSYHLSLAGQIDDALTCHAQSALSAYRERRATTDPEELRRATGWSEIESYLGYMKAAQVAYEERRVNDGLSALESIEGFLPEILIAERDCLAAHFLLLSHSVPQYEQARTTLRRWDDLADREAELWARIGQILIVADVMTDRSDEARRLEGEITANYWKRRHADPRALYGLNALRRRAECLHTLPTATLRLESALAYFGPASPDSAPRHPIEYYYTLVNLTGNLVANGAFDRACEKVDEIERLVNSQPVIPWPGLENAANNAILARYRNGEIEVTTCCRLLEQLVNDLSEYGDKVLLQNNLAVFLALDDRLDEARTMLSSMFSTLADDPQADEYHQYFVGSNLASLLGLMGTTIAGRDLLREQGPLLGRFYPALRATMQRRHELALDQFADSTRLTPREFDLFLLKRYPAQLGPQWSFYGHGFLLSDIQFWSAD